MKPTTCSSTLAPLLTLSIASACFHGDDYLPADDESSTMAEDPADSTGDGDDGDGDGSGDGDGDGDGEPEAGDGDGDPLLCMAAADCLDPLAPLCDLNSGECIACDEAVNPDSACALADPSAPVCLAGACVGCDFEDQSACSDETPICDLKSNTCIECSAHDDCDSGACDFAAHSCIPEANQLHVDGAAANCPTATGSEDKPYCDIEAALTAAEDGAVILIHYFPGAYVGSYEIDQRVVLMQGSEVRPWLIAPDHTTTSLTVTETGSLTIKGLLFASGSHGIENLGGRVWLEESVMYGSENWGVRSDGGEVTIRRSTVTNNSTGAIRLEGEAVAWIENSFIGGESSDTALQMLTGSVVSISYSTLMVDSDSSTSALICGNGSGSVLRNSVVVSFSDRPAVSCFNLSKSGNVVDSNTASSWFDYFELGMHLEEGKFPLYAATAATWMPGDPATDFDGDPRPTYAGAPDYAGADRLP